MSEAPNPQTEQAPADAQNAEGIDAAAAAFAAMGNQEHESEEQPTEDQAEPDPEPESEADTEAQEADPEAEEPTEELAEVEFEGKTYNVPRELEKALLRQADYSRKMNEVSAKEKTYSTRLEAIEGLEQAAEKRAESLAKIRQLDDQIKQYEGINWTEARQTDPANAALAAVELMSLQQAKQQALEAAKQVDSTIREHRSKLTAEQLAERNKVLDKELPGWNGEVGARLTEYAVKQGMNFDYLAQITDPKVFIALEKARKFDELQASKPSIKAKVASAAPVTKPGAPRKVDAKTEAFAQLRKTGSIDSAAAAFLAIG